jgi:hypothetical protein
MNSQISGINKIFSRDVSAPQYKLSSNTIEKSKNKSYKYSDSKRNPKKEQLQIHLDGNNLSARQKQLCVELLAYQFNPDDDKHRHVMLSDQVLSMMSNCLSRREESDPVFPFSPDKDKYKNLFTLDLASNYLAFSHLSNFAKYQHGQGKSSEPRVDLSNYHPETVSLAYTGIINKFIQDLFVAVIKESAYALGNDCVTILSGARRDTLFKACVQFAINFFELDLTSDSTTKSFVESLDAPTQESAMKDITPQLLADYKAQGKSGMVWKLGNDSIFACCYDYVLANRNKVSQAKNDELGGDPRAPGYVMDTANYASDGWKSTNPLSDDFFFNAYDTDDAQKVGTQPGFGVRILRDDGNSVEINTDEFYIGHIELFALQLLTKCSGAFTEGKPVSLGPDFGKNAESRSNGTHNYLFGNGDGSALDSNERLWQHQFSNAAAQANAPDGTPVFTFKWFLPVLSDDPDKEDPSVIYPLLSSNQVMVEIIAMQNSLTKFAPITSYYTLFNTFNNNNNALVCKGSNSHLGLTNIELKLPIVTLGNGDVNYEEFAKYTGNYDIRLQNGKVSLYYAANSGVYENIAKNQELYKGAKDSYLGMVGGYKKQSHVNMFGGANDEIKLWVNSSGPNFLLSANWLYNVDVRGTFNRNGLFKFNPLEEWEEAISNLYELDKYQIHHFAQGLAVLTDFYYQFIADNSEIYKNGKVVTEYTSTAYADLAYVPTRGQVERSSINVSGDSVIGSYLYGHMGILRTGAEILSANNITINLMGVTDLNEDTHKKSNSKNTYSRDYSKAPPVNYNYMTGGSNDNDANFKQIISRVLGSQYGQYSNLVGGTLATIAVDTGTNYNGAHLVKKMKNELDVRVNQLRVKGTTIDPTDVQKIHAKIEELEEAINSLDKVFEVLRSLLVSGEAKGRIPDLETYILEYINQSENVKSKYEIVKTYVGNAGVGSLGNVVVGRFP